jgi:uncharacterized protein (TIGR00255 family)
VGNLNSMTGYAGGAGTGLGHAWTWDLRSVNGRGLDLRLRLPDWIEGLEPAARAAVGRVAVRGSITLSLRITRDAAGPGGGAVDRAALARALAQVAAVQQMAVAAGVVLAPPSAVDILGLRGPTEAGPDEETRAALLALLTDDLARLAADFATARASEGAALAAILTGHVDAIAALAEAAARAAEARRPEAERALRDAMARVTAEGVDPARIHAELALLAVKADITEEIDRLRAHVAAARALIAEGGAVGRKLDFLTQEFMREANTLCSKAQNPALTATGLDLKAVIDQMREQVQNVE